MRELTKFTRFIRQYGLEVRVLRSGHNGIFKDGRKIYRFAGSPKNAHEAVDNNLKDLVRDGHLPSLTYNGRQYKRRDDA